MPLNVISSSADSRILDIVENKHVVIGRSDLERLLESQTSQTTLDLIGHSVSDLLELGNWIIDETAAPWFRLHAAALRRFEAVRLIGCHTAVSAKARSTICMIADALGVQVYGSTGFVFPYHFTAEGFDPMWRFLLNSSADLS